jgi:general L-amino acid transport system permease protein
MTRAERARALLWQAAVVAAVAALVALLAAQTARNLEQRGIASGFAYLGRAAGFEIASGPLDYSPSDTYARALALGVANTVRVSLLSIVVATVLGVAVAALRMSGLWVASASARAYVEVLRNTPLLLQLLFWYAVWQRLPGPRDALAGVGGVLLCDRGLFLPRLVWEHGAAWFGGLGIERPALAGFGIHGGTSISPEFAALFVGLSAYTAAFLAEIVRGGVASVARGQVEAARALGLSRGAAARLVVFPQALRAIVPPATTQFVGVLKNSSLAVAIGYSDILSITNTTLNQTGQSIEAIAMAMLCYLVLGAVLSAAMRRYEHVVAVRGGAVA